MNCEKFKSAKPILYSAIAYIIASIVMSLITSPYFNFKDFVEMEVFADKAKLFYDQLYLTEFQKAYKLALIWDFPYMLAYGAFLFYTITYLACKKNPKLLSLAFLPLAAVFADILENAMEFLIIAKYPQINDSMLMFRIADSNAKWMFVASSILLILFLLVYPSKTDNTQSVG